MKTCGFSLVELLITVLILTILTIFAYPNYLSQVTKTRRTDAMGVLVQDAAFMERFYTLNGCYNSVGADGICGTSDDTKPTPPYLQSPASGNTVFYAISLAVGRTGSSYTLTADPSGTPQAADRSLTLDNTGAQTWANNPSGNTNSWR